MEPDRSRANEPFWRAYAPAWLVFLLGVVLSVAVGKWFLREAERVDTDRFRSAVTRVMDHLDERTERYALELQRFADILEKQEGEIEVALWEELLNRISPRSNLPALLELAWATNSGLRTAAEVELLAAKPSLSPDGEWLLPRMRVSPPMPVVYQWLNGAVITPEQTAEWLMEREVQYIARGTWQGRMIASPPRKVRTKAGETAAVCYFVPVFTPDLLALTTKYPQLAAQELHPYRFRGLLIGTLGWEEFLKTALSGELRQIGLEAFGDTNAPNAMFMGRMDGKPSQVMNSEFRPRHREDREWPFFRQRWKLVFYSTAEFDALSPRFRGWVAMGGGMVLSMTMAGLVGVQIRGRLRQKEIAEQLQVVLSALESAKAERERLSHDLHDGTIQSLYALQLGLSRSIELAKSAAPGLGQRLMEHRRTLSMVIGEVRGFILRHENQEGPSGDLAGVIEVLVGRLRPSTETVFRTDLCRQAAKQIPSTEAVHLANLTREALSNALRHAQAREINVSLKSTNEKVILEIRDDGSGIPAVEGQRRGLGMTSMARRARAAGGELKIESEQGMGTKVRVTIPIGEHEKGKEGLKL